jgi:UDP-N-acetylmuramyl pentapeptide synthase
MRADRHVAVLGVMAEIAEPEPSHRQIAEYAHELGIELIAVGTALYGIEPTDDVRSAIGALDADVAVLVKASRAAGLERVVLTLRGDGVMG